VDILRDGKRIDTMQPGKNQYLAEQQVSNEMAIRTDPLRAEDLNLILDQSNPDGSICLKVVVKPLVNLIWASGIVFVLGSLIALWPDAREQRRLLERYQSARNLARS
jgi:cytochrome c biogenesis factor